MKLASITVLLALFGAAFAEMNLYGKGPEKEVRKNTWGHYEIIERTEHGSLKDVILSSKNYIRDYVAQAEFLTQAIQQVKINEEN